MEDEIREGEISEGVFGNEWRTKLVKDDFSEDEISEGVFGNEWNEISEDEISEGVFGNEWRMKLAKAKLVKEYSEMSEGRN